MPVKQTFIVRRGNGDRFRALQETFGAAPISATVTWDRREVDRRRRRSAQTFPSTHRRAERRGSEPSSWSALDFLVIPRVGCDPPVKESAQTRRGRFIPARETLWVAGVDAPEV